MLGISGNYYNQYSVYNTSFFNLAQQNNNKLSQILSARNNSTVSPVKNVLDNTTKSFLKDYESNMRDLMRAANDLRDVNSSGSLGKMELSSSDAATVDAKTLFTLRDKASYDIQVEQLAASQVDTSAKVNANDPAAFTGGSLTIQMGTQVKNVNLLEPTEGMTNKEYLRKAAEDINRMDMGVTARAVEKDGKVSLELTGKQTGEIGAFSVSGSFANQAGISTTQNAQNAIYTVEKQGDPKGAKQYTSSDNTVGIDGFKIQATLKKEGKATISVGVNTEKTVDAMQKMVDSFNKTLTFLNKNADRGIGVLTQMKRMVVPPASEQGMQKIGLSINKDGTLKLDTAALTKALKENPDFTTDLISGSNGVAQGVFTDAVNGLKMSSSSLVGNDLRQSQLQQSNITSQTMDPIRFWGTYSRSGAYNMSNYYAVGMLMNMSI